MFKHVLIKSTLVQPSRGNITHINLVTERGIGAVLELALVVCGVADSQASQGCGEVPLGRTIIQTETPTATWKHRRGFIHIYVIYVQFDAGKRSGVDLSAA